MPDHIGTYEDQQGAEKYGKGGRDKFVKVYFANGYTQYQPYVIDAGADGLTAIAPATLAIGRKIGVPQGATTAVAGWYWVQVRGRATCLVDGTADCAAGAFLEVINAGTAAILDHATVRTAGSFATIVEAYATNSAAAKAVNLLDREVTIAAA